MSFTKLSPSATRAGLLSICVVVLSMASYAQTVVGLVNVLQAPSSIAVNPTTDRIYVVNFTSEDVTVLNGQAVVTTVSPVGIRPWRPAVDTVRNLVYVANFGSPGLTVINGANNTVLRTITTAPAPEAVAVDETRDRVFVVHSGQVEIFSGGSTSPFTVPAGNGASHVAVNPVTGNAYVSNTFDNTVSVIFADLSTTTVPVGIEPSAIAVNPVTNRVYVLNRGSGNMTLIDGSTLATTPVLLTGVPEHLVVNPETNRIYVTNETSNVTVIQGDTLATTPVSVAGRPTALAVNPRTNYVYVVTTTNFLTSINGQTNGTTSIEVGREPVDVAVNPITNLIYTANRLGNSVTIVRGLSENTPQIFWPSPAPITIGTPLGATQLNAGAFLNDAAVAGTFVYDPPAGTVLAQGTNTLSVTFTPSDTSLTPAFGDTTIDVLAIDFALSPDPVVVNTIAPTTGTAVLTVRSVGSTPFDRRINFQCTTESGFDVPTFVSCDSPVVDFRGNTDPNATREVTVHIFTDGRGTPLAMSRTQRMGGWAFALMLPIAGILLAVSPSASRKKRSVWLLCLGLMLIILAAGCATKFEQPKSFRMRIRAFAEDGGPTHSVSVTVGLNPDGGN